MAPLPVDIAPPPPPPPAAAPPPPPPRPPAALPTFLATPPGAVAPLPLPAAVAAVLSQRRARFCESVDLTVRLGVDPKRSDQVVRGVAALPHGTGRRLRVAVFASGDAADAARAAGADIVGLDDLVAAIKAGGPGAIGFDKAVATPAAMPKLASIARLLGPRGLMPNPKTGTLTADVAGAVAALRRGAVSFKADRAGAVHCAVGRVDFPPASLEENIAAALAAVVASRPVGLKGGGGGKGAGFVRSAHLSTTMGRGSVRVRLDGMR